MQTLKSKISSKEMDALILTLLGCNNDIVMIWC